MNTQGISVGDVVSWDDVDGPEHTWAPDRLVGEVREIKNGELHVKRCDGVESEGFHGPLWIVDNSTAANVRVTRTDTLAAVDRKAEPVFSGVLAYFPLTLRAMSRLSKAGNDKHNPGEPLHWNRAKSTDDADALARHLLDHAQDPTGVDPDSGELHAVSAAWRACAVAEKALEALAKGPRK